MAGNLMTPYATVAAHPMPCGNVPLSAVLYPKLYPITVKPRVKIAPEMKVREVKAQVLSVDKYIACLSTTEWRTSFEIAQILGFAQQAVSNYMRSARMKKLVYCRMKKRGSKHWLMYQLRNPVSVSGISKS